MKQNSIRVNKAQFARQSMKVLKYLRDLMLIVLALDFLRHQLWHNSQSATSLVVVVEHWHLWLVILVYVLTILMWLSVMWMNRLRVWVLLRRIQAAYSNLTA